MRRLFLFLIMIMAALAVHAYCIVFTPLGHSTEPRNFSFGTNGVSLYFKAGIDDGTYYKALEGNTMQLQSSVGNITRVVVECVGKDNEAHGPGHLKNTRGQYVHDRNFGVWEGSSQWVTFDVDEEVWITRVLVFFGAPKPLEIEPITPNQYYSFSVTMSSAYYDAKIYYTLDGSIPTANSNEFYNSFRLDSSTTVRAIAVRDGVVIDSASISYEYVEPVKVNNIQEGLAVPDGTAVRFLNSVRVVEHRNPYLWVKDDSGYALIYGDCAYTYERGNLIFSGLGGTKATINGAPVFIKPGGFRASLLANNSPVTPEEISLDKVDLSLFAYYVFLKDLTIKPADDGQSYILTDKKGNLRIANFDKTGVAVPYNLEDPYNMWAIVGANSGAPMGCELLLLLLEEAPEEIEGDDPIVITPNQVGPSTCGHEVILRQVLAYTGRISNFDGETCEGYITYDPILPTVLTWGYDIKGVVEEYEYWEILYQRTGYRLRVDNIIGLHSGHNDIADIKRIKGLYNMRPPKGDDIYFFLSGHFVEPLTVVYENGGLLYVRDSYGDYALVEGFFQGTFTNGDLIYDAIAYPDYYYAEYNPIFPTDISSFTPGGHHDAVEPDVFSINDLDTDLLHHYVRINAVTLTDADDQGRQFIVDDTGTLQLLDRFSTGIPQDSNNGSDKLPEDLNGDSMVNVSDINILINTILTGTAAKTATNAGTLYDVIGFLGIRNGQLVFYPTEIIYHENVETQAGDLNDDGRVNISDINCLIHYILNH